MDNARVVIIEDKPLFSDEAKIHLTLAGHNVVAVAGNREKALDIIRQLAEGALEADVILLDGTLRRTSTDSGEDARVIAAKVKELGITAKLLGFSLEPMESFGVEVAADPGKAKMQRVVEAIARL